MKVLALYSWIGQSPLITSETVVLQQNSIDVIDFCAFQDDFIMDNFEFINSNDVYTLTVGKYCFLLKGVLNYISILYQL